MVKPNHIESLLWNVLNEPSGHIVVKFEGILWKNSQWVAQAHGGHIENEPTWLIDKMINQWLTAFFDGFFQNLLSMCSLIPSRSKWWVNWECAHNSPLGKLRVNCLKTLNKLSICLPGKTPSAPSERLYCVIAHLFHNLSLSFSLPFLSPLPNFLTFFPILHSHDQQQDNETW